MSEADRVLLAFTEETGSWGVTPTAALQNLRMTSESLAQATRSVESAEIRSDGQTPDIYRTGINAEGAINFELSATTYDLLMESALRSAGWTTGVEVDSADTAISVAAGVLTHTTAWANNPTVGSWIYVSGFSGAMAANNGWHRVTAATSTTITTSSTLTDGAAGDSVTIKEADHITNGVAERSFSFERDYTDLAGSDDYVNYLGMIVDTMAISIPTEGLVTGNFGLIGKAEASSATTIGTGSNTAATSTVVMNTIDHVTQVQQALTTFGIIGLDINTTSNLRQRPQVGSLGPISIGKGKFRATGTVRAYFSEAALIDKYLNWTDVALNCGMVDDAGNGYLIELPAVKFTNATRVAGGENSDVIADVTWSAKMHATDGYTMKLARITA